MTLEFSGADAGVVVSMTAKKINILNCDQRYSIRPVESGSATGALAQSPPPPPLPQGTTEVSSSTGLFTHYCYTNEVGRHTKPSKFWCDDGIQRTP